MSRREVAAAAWALGLLAALATTGCNGLPGRPGPVPSVLETGRVASFDALYGKNCAACHGVSGKGGAAIALDDPVYLTMIEDKALRNAIAKGISGTPMPAFAESAGGMLTDDQIDTLVNGIRDWSRSGQLAGVNVPPYSASSQGDRERGAKVYAQFCASCHGPGGTGGKKAGSVVDPSFLALVSNQGLRTVVILGRPELGAPDWRNDWPGHPMTGQQITDVVSWLEAHRAAYPGRPDPDGGSGAAGEKQ